MKNNSIVKKTRQKLTTGQLTSYAQKLKTVSNRLLSNQELKQIIPVLNKRSLTKKDFYSICKKKNITVFVSDEMKLKGFYVLCEGESIIFLNKNLRGFLFLRVAFHELGHALLHIPLQSSLPDAPKPPKHLLEKHHLEAEAFCALAMKIPFDAGNQFFAERIVSNKL